MVRIAAAGIAYSVHIKALCFVLLCEIVEARLEQQLRKVDSAAHGAVGQTFNLSSPEQVSKLLYDTLHLNSDQMTALESIEASHGSGSTGRKRHASTSEEELQRIAHAHPVVPLILHHRALSKLLSTYIYGIKPLLAPDPAHASMASIHAIWNQTSVRTGRLSCAQPNLQNIPNLQSIDGETYDIRSIFLPRPGFLLVGADYSQIEMRVLAHLCQDPSLCDLFRQVNHISPMECSGLIGYDVSLLGGRYLLFTSRQNLQQGAGRGGGFGARQGEGHLPRYAPHPSPRGSS